MSTKPNIDMPPEILLDFLNKHIKLCSLEGQTHVLIGNTLAHDIAMALRDMVQIDSVLTRRTALDSIPRRFDKIVKCLNTAATADPNDKQAEYITLLEGVASAASILEERQQTTGLISALEKLRGCDLRKIR